MQRLAGISQGRTKTFVANFPSEAVNLSEKRLNSKKTYNGPQNNATKL